MFGLVGSDKFDIKGDNGPLLMRVQAAMICISGLAVILRFVARKVAKQSIGWDDWHIVIALVFSWAICVVQFTGIGISNFGKHLVRSKPVQIKSFFVLLYINQQVYLFAIAFIKFSILAFYRRVFSVSSTKIPAYAIAAIVIAWLIANSLVGFFSCTPVYAFWNRKLPAECVNTIQYYFGTAIPNIVTDGFLMAFPIPLIWNLKLRVAQKIALSSIFAIGGFIIVVSSLRLVTVLVAEDDVDFTWTFIPLAIWNVVETNVGILLACLPSMQPLLRMMLGSSPLSTKRGTDSGELSRTRKIWPSTTRSTLKRLGHPRNSEDEVLMLESFGPVGQNKGSIGDSNPVDFNDNKHPV